METHGCTSSCGDAASPRGVQRHESIPTRRRHPGHEGPVGHLRHGLLAEHPIRPVELGLLAGHRCALRLRPGDPHAAGRAATNRGDRRRSAMPRRCSRPAGRPTPPRHRRRAAPARPPAAHRARAGCRQPGQGAGPRRSRRPTACPDGPRPPRRAGRRSDAAEGCRRSRARRAAWFRTAPQRGSTGRPRCAAAEPILRGGSRARPAPTRRPPWRSTRRVGAPPPSEAPRPGPPARSRPPRPAPSQNHTRWSAWST